uniref:Uncharacterized protein n=1 Tax=Romanomermis culicivorax TaxID=13658 RepID=A0A915KT01_ROMCU
MLFLYKAQFKSDCRRLSPIVIDCRQLFPIPWEFHLRLLPILPVQKTVVDFLLAKPRKPRLLQASQS